MNALPEDGTKFSWNTVVATVKGHDIRQCWSRKLGGLIYWVEDMQRGSDNLARAKMIAGGEA